MRYRWIALVFIFLFGTRDVCALEKEVLLILDPGHGGKDQGGYDGGGFKIDGARIPEDAYMYDVARRVEQQAWKKGWKIFFTVIDRADTGIYDYDEDRIIPPKKNLIYNLPGTPVFVFPGKDGLLKRLEAVRHSAGAFPHAIKIFISFHFDYAPSVTRGAKIFTARGMAGHHFIKILADHFKKAGLELRVRGAKQPMIDSHNKLVVLGENPIEPRVLIELGNFNHLDDRRILLSAEGREKYASVIIEVIEQWLMAQKKKTNRC